MVQVVPGVADQLAEPLQMFAAGLEKYMKPDLEFQKAMQKAIGVNPQLAQQLSDVEKSSPGTLDRMGFGNLGKVISSIPESVEGQAGRELRPDAVAAAKTKIILDKEKGGFDLQRLIDTNKAIAANPRLRGDEIYRLLNGHSIAGAEIEQAEAGAAPAEAAAKKSTAEITRAAMDKAMENLPAMKDMDFMKMARDYRNPSAPPLDAGTLAAMNNIPGVKQAWDQALEGVDREKADALQRFLARDRNDLKENFKTEKAFQMYKDSNTGTLDSWKTFMFEGGREKIPDLQARQKKGEKLTSPELDLLHTYEGEQRLNLQERMKDLNTVNARIEAAHSKLAAADKGNESPESINLLAVDLQGALDQKSEITGRKIIVRTGKRPDVGDADYSFWGTWGQGQGLWFADEDGRRLDPSAILADSPVGKNTAAPNATTKAEVDKAEDANARRAFMQLNSLPPSSQAEGWANLQKSNPVLFKRVQEMQKTGNVNAKPAADTTTPPASSIPGSTPSTPGPTSPALSTPAVTTPDLGGVPGTPGTIPSHPTDTAIAAIKPVEPGKSVVSGVSNENIIKRAVDSIGTKGQLKNHPPEAIVSVATGIRDAISKVESGGDYQAKSKTATIRKNTDGTTRKDWAYGKYQVMGEYIPSWTREALGKSMTIKEFLADPKAQDATALYKLTQAYAQHGSIEDAASVWFTGRPVKNQGKTPDSSGTKPDVYVQRFLKAYYGDSRKK